jgi:hypothetical protein
MEKIDIPSLAAFKRPIGELLLEREIISHHDLEFALEHQKFSTSGEFIGQILVRIGAISAEELENVLAMQIAQSMM